MNECRSSVYEPSLKVGSSKEVVGEAVNIIECLRFGRACAAGTLKKKSPKHRKCVLKTIPVALSISPQNQGENCVAFYCKNKRFAV